MSRLAAIRAGYRLAQLACPQRLADRLPGERGRVAARILGARHLAQACLSGPAPTAALLALGAEADLLHAMSMIGLAVASRPWRRAALADAAAAVAAVAFAAAGAVATRRARACPSARDPGCGLVRLRNGARMPGHGAWFPAGFWLTQARLGNRVEGACTGRRRPGRGNPVYIGIGTVVVIVIIVLVVLMLRRR